jgi:hypothetical protein
MLSRFEIVTSGSPRPDAEKIIFCDGSGGRLFRPQTDLELSHWRPNRTPPQYRGDTSTAACFRFLDQPQPGLWAAAVNNHLDVDGILSVYVLVHSAHALRHRDTIVAAAEMGDFWVWGPPAAQRLFQGITLLMDALRELQTETRAIYEQAFARIPALIDGSDLDAAAIDATLRPLRSAAELVEQGTIARRPLGDRFTQYIVPLAIAGDDDGRAAYVPQFNEAVSDRAVLWPQVHSRWDDERVRLISIERPAGWFHSLWYPGYLWADTQDRWRTPGLNYGDGMESYELDHPALLEALKQLQAREPQQGMWAAGNGASPFHRELQSIFPVVARFTSDTGSASTSGLGPDAVAAILSPVFA